MGDPKGNGRDPLVERMVDVLLRIEKNTADMRDELVGVNTRLDRVEMRMERVENRIERVEHRLDNLRDIAGEKYRDLEARVAVIEKKLR